MEEKKFQISLSNEKKEIIIRYKETPVSFEDFAEIFKELMLAWGFSEETVKRYFEYDDILLEYEEMLNEKNKLIEKMETEIKNIKNTEDKIKNTEEEKKNKYLILHCLKCDNYIRSMHRHDFATCSCGTCFIDGGNEYARYGAPDDSSFELYIEDEKGVRTLVSKPSDNKFDKNDRKVQNDM